MGLLTSLIIKGVTTAAAKSTIKTVGKTAIEVIDAKSKSEAQKDNSVVKNGILHIKPPHPSEEYLDKNALDVSIELLGVGFESVELKAVKKLGERGINKYGNVRSISINGDKDFFGIRKVPASSHIVIEFLDFKDGLNPETYTKVKRLKTGKICSINDLEDKSNNISNAKRYCIYCGEPITNGNAKFCFACGKAIN